MLVLNPGGEIKADPIEICFQDTNLVKAAQNFDKEFQMEPCFNYLSHFFP